MKATLHKLCIGMFLYMATLIPVEALAQIDYSENFNTDEHRWTTLDFYTTDVAVCGNNFAYRANPINEAGVTVPVETVSPSLGVSNGEELTLSYSYKLLDYDEVLPYTAVDDDDWGIFILEYGPTNNGPWTELDVITPYEHSVSTECERRTVKFIPEEDTEVFLRVTVDAGTTPDVSYFVYLDDISAYQQTLTIDPLLTADVEVYPNPVTNFLTLDYPGYITDVVVFNMQGQAVVVEDMDNDFRRLNMEGLASGQYIVTVATDDLRVRRINVIKE